MKHFHGLGHHRLLWDWTSGILSGYRQCIAAMLLLMLPQTTDLGLFAYGSSTIAQPQSAILNVLFAARSMEDFNPKLRLLFESRLNKVTRLSLWEEA
jgi:hypothetical protein